MKNPIHVFVSLIRDNCPWGVPGTPGNLRTSFVLLRRNLALVGTSLRLQMIYIDKVLAYLGPFDKKELGCCAGIGARRKRWVEYWSSGLLDRFS